VLPPARRDLSGRVEARWYPEADVTFFLKAAEESGFRTSQSTRCRDAFATLVAAEWHRREVDDQAWQQGLEEHREDWGDPKPQVSAGPADSYGGELADVDEDDVGLGEADYVGGGPYDDYRFEQKRPRTRRRVRQWLTGSDNNPNLVQYRRDDDEWGQPQRELLVPTCPGCLKPLHTTNVARGLGTILIWVCSDHGQVVDPLGATTVGGAASAPYFGVQMARGPIRGAMRPPEPLNPYLLED
jgi:hypothetical protein